MLLIKVREGENIERALRRYKRKHRNTKLRNEVRDRKYFVKPSTRRRKEIEAARYKQLKADQE